MIMPEEWMNFPSLETDPAPIFFFCFCTLPWLRISIVLLLLLAGLARDVPEFMTLIYTCGTLSVWTDAAVVTTWTSWGHIARGEMTMTGGQELAEDVGAANRSDSAISTPLS
jgi:hypothetical protein